MNVDDVVGGEELVMGGGQLSRRGPVWWKLDVDFCAYRQGFPSVWWDGCLPSQ